MLRQPRREQPSEAENPRCSNSTRTRLSLFIVELGCRERAFFARRPARREYLRVGVQASLSAIGARCRRVGSPRAGVRPIQRLNSGPPAPLSQPHSGCRSCARRSQTREAEAADSARGPRGARAALKTCRGGGAACRAPSSERPVFRVALPVVEARRVNEHESLGGRARDARHIDLHNSAARAQGQRGEDVMGSLLGRVRCANLIILVRAPRDQIVLLVRAIIRADALQLVCARQVRTAVFSQT